MDESQITPAEEVKQTEQEVVEETIETPSEPTIENITNQKESENVPLKTFLEVKKEKKELEKEIATLKNSIKSGATKSEVKADLKSIADKYDVDPNFLNELSSTIYAQAKAEAENAIKPVLEEKNKEKLDKVLSDHLDKALEAMPEYSNVVNKEVVKSLAQLPQNKNKTFQQIIEETYGNSVSGRKTMETSTPRGGKDVGINWDKVNDPQYFKEIMANPELKKQYNEGLVSRINI